jgi:hypothetical protein
MQLEQFVPRPGLALAAAANQFVLRIQAHCRNLMALCGRCNHKLLAAPASISSIECLYEYRIVA